MIFLMISSLTNIVLDLLFVIQFNMGLRGGLGDADRPRDVRGGVPAGGVPKNEEHAL